jgi:hypothetical protein
MAILLSWRICTNLPQETVCEKFNLWKEAQQEEQQHWFIDGYIAAYIQVPHRVIGVHPTGLTVDQGFRQVSTGLPPSSGLGWKEKRSEVQPLWWCMLTGQVPRVCHL